MGSTIERLLRCPEGKTLEFKRDLSSPRSWRDLGARSGR